MHEIHWWSRTTDCALTGIFIGQVMSHAPSILQVEPVRWMRKTRTRLLSPSSAP
jgi:hypothetical protein